MVYYFYKNMAVKLKNINLALAHILSLVFLCLVGVYTKQFRWIARQGTQIRIVTEIEKGTACWLVSSIPFVRIFYSMKRACNSMEYLKLRH